MFYVKFKEHKVRMSGSWISSPFYSLCCYLYIIIVIIKLIFHLS